jgi:hypothetical protein
MRITEVSQAEEGSLDEQAPTYLERNGSANVQELHDAPSVKSLLETPQGNIPRVSPDMRQIRERGTKHAHPEGVGPHFSPDNSPYQEPNPWSDESDRMASFVVYPALGEPGACHVELAKGEIHQLADTYSAYHAVASNTLGTIRSCKPRTFTQLHHLVYGRNSTLIAILTTGLNA